MSSLISVCVIVQKELLNVGMLKLIKILIIIKISLPESERQCIWLPQIKLALSYDLASIQFSTRKSIN